MTRGPAPTGSQVLAMAACSAVLLALAAYLVRFSINMPYLDEWLDTLPLAARLQEGSLSVEDLWRSHNGHRIVFPRLILLGVAHLTRWNVRYVVSLNFLLSVGTLWVVGAVALKTRREGHGGWAAFIVASSLLLFSFGHWRNWLNAFQVALFMSVFFATLGISLLSAPVLTLGRMVGAGVCGLLATGSFGNGPIYWLVGLALLVVRRAEPKKQFSWLIVSALVIAAYVHALGTRVDGVGSRHPATYLTQLMIYLGRPVCTFNDSGAQLLGAIGSCAFLAMIGATLWRRQERAPMALFALGMGLYSLLSGAMTVWIRPGVSPQQYTIAVPLWIANAAMLIAGDALAIAAWARVGVRLFCLAALPVLLNSYRDGYLYSSRQHAFLLSTRDYLVAHRAQIPTGSIVVTPELRSFFSVDAGGAIRTTDPDGYVRSKLQLAHAIDASFLDPSAD